MNYDNYPQNYMLAHHKQLSKHINECPSIKIRSENGHSIYLVNNNGIRNRYRTTSPKGREYAKLYELRTTLKKELDEMAQVYSDRFGSNIENDAATTRFTSSPRLNFDKAFFDSLKPCATTYPNNNRYFYRNVNYRSRAEMVIAQVLDEMGLTYKYDCEIITNGITHTVDFAVYLPEFGCCFFIEYLGRLRDERYVDDNKFKLKDYLMGGIYIGRELLILCGDDIYMPPVNVIRSEIAKMLYIITDLHTVSARTAAR